MTDSVPVVRGVLVDLWRAIVAELGDGSAIVRGYSAVASDLDVESVRVSRDIESTGAARTLLSREPEEGVISCWILLLMIVPRFASGREALLGGKDSDWGDLCSVHLNDLERYCRGEVRVMSEAPLDDLSVVRLWSLPNPPRLWLMIDRSLPSEKLTEA